MTRSISRRCSRRSAGSRARRNAASAALYSGVRFAGMTRSTPALRIVPPLRSPLHAVLMLPRDCRRTRALRAESETNPDAAPTADGSPRGDESLDADGVGERVPVEGARRGVPGVGHVVDARPDLEEPDRSITHVEA